MQQSVDVGRGRPSSSRPGVSERSIWAMVAPASSLSSSPVATAETTAMPVDPSVSARRTATLILVVRCGHGLRSRSARLLSCSSGAEWTSAVATSEQPAVAGAGDRFARFRSRGGSRGDDRISVSRWRRPGAGRRVGRGCCDVRGWGRRAVGLVCRVGCRGRRPAGSDSRRALVVVCTSIVDRRDASTRV